MNELETLIELFEGNLKTSDAGKFVHHVLTSGSRLATYPMFWDSITDKIIAEVPKTLEKYVLSDKYIDLFKKYKKIAKQSGAKIEICFVTNNYKKTFDLLKNEDVVFSSIKPSKTFDKYLKSRNTNKLFINGAIS